MLSVVKSVADLDRAIVANLHRIPAVDAIVGIPRSGMLAASSLALHMQKPLADIEGFGRGEVFRRSASIAHDVKRVLLFDDTVLTGKAMQRSVLRLRQLRPDVTIVRGAVFSAPHTPPGSVDLALEVCPTPRAFAWNMWKHKRLPRWCFDLDGVFCPDPTNAENDDGPRYLEFIRTAPPLFRPRRPIGWIVTARLEKYRAETEAWLHRQGVTFAGLVMMDLPDKAARMEAGNRAGFKAKAYQALGPKYAELFVESNPRQAAKIAAMTGKPVWCTSSQQFHPAAPAAATEALS